MSAALMNVPINLNGAMVEQRVGGRSFPTSTPPSRSVPVRAPWSAPPSPGPTSTSRCSS
ncbi:hypothetical protein NKG05_12030 [Oerskovia sp. M15]